MKTGEEAGPAPTYVTESDEPLGEEEGPAFDVVVCGGTLGIFVATALQMRCVALWGLGCVLPVRGKLGVYSLFPWPERVL